MQIRMNIGDNKNGLYSLILIGFLLLSSPSILWSQDNEVLTYNGREINISPYFEDFPYSQFSVSREGSKLLFFDQSQGQKLRILDIKTDFDLKNAKEVIDVDFSSRNAWSPTYNKKDDGVYWIGDESNEEIINIYRVILGSDKLEKLTDKSYIYAWNFNPEGTKIAYTARLGSSEDSASELRVIDLNTLEDHLILRDNQEYQFTWSDISWLPNDKGITILVVKNQDRTYTDVAYINFDTPSFHIITDTNKSASLSGTGTIDGWLDSNSILYQSDEDDFSNLYKYDIISNSSTKITDYKADLNGVNYVTVEGEKYLLAIQKNPIQSKIILIDPETGKELWVKETGLNVSFGATNKDQVLFITQGTHTIFDLQEGKITKKGLDLNKLGGASKDIEGKLIHSKVERLSIPTFDIDPLTQKKRELHAYLYKPLNPPKKGEEVVMIEAFYGGSNSYDRDYQILNQAGIYVLSPSPRGSAGFGKDFMAMNDGDLGGNEIIDIIYTAKYISEKLNIPPERIGVFGMSHGGYATMRLMTFPGEINGNTARFPFGFGVETAGFADIIYQHETSNIPGWTLLEAGDPKVDSLKLMDRSPITHADKISGSLLLFHGNHDNRVNVEGSRKMANKLKSLNKPYEYVEFEGLGHGIKGIENIKTYFKTTFKFIEREVLKE